MAWGSQGFAKPAEVRSLLAGFISSLKAEGAGRNFQFFPDRRPHFARAHVTASGRRRANQLHALAD